jgi:hypothetical protein
MVIGAAGAALPDVVLALYGWRKEWLPEAHPLVRAHRFLHSTSGLVVPITIGWVSHIVLDKHSTHRQAP